MKGRYPLAPMIAPGILGGVTAVALVLALLDDGPVQWLGVLALGGVVGLIAVKLAGR